MSLIHDYPILLETCPKWEFSNSHESSFYLWTVLIATKGCVCVCVCVFYVFPPCACRDLHSLGSVWPSGAVTEQLPPSFLETVPHAWEAIVLLLELGNTFLFSSNLTLFPFWSPPVSVPQCLKVLTSVAQGLTTNSGGASQTQFCLAILEIPFLRCLILGSHYTKIPQVCLLSSLYR